MDSCDPEFLRIYAEMEHERRPWEPWPPCVWCGKQYIDHTYELSTSPPRAACRGLRSEFTLEPPCRQ